MPIHEAGHEGAVIRCALNERVDGLSVRPYGCQHDAPMFISEFGRLSYGLSAPPHGFLERMDRIVDPERKIFHAVSVLMHVASNVGVWPQRRRQHEPDLLLLEHIAHGLAMAGFRAPIGHDP